MPVVGGHAPGARLRVVGTACNLRKRATELAEQEEGVDAQFST